MKTPVRFPFLLALLLIFCLPIQATTRPSPDWWVFLFGKNKYDKRGLYHGRWVTYHDDAKTVVMSKGRFRHGRQIKTWTYFTDSGTLYRKEVYARQGEEIATTLYHPNGAVSVTGTAKRVEDAIKIHYFWQGYWYYFTEEGLPEKKTYYSNGVLVETTALEPAQAGQKK